MDPGRKLSNQMCPETEEEKQQMANVPYQAAIGLIMYVAQISRPDICFAVSFLSQYNTNYGEAHWTAVKRVLRYLKGTIDLKMTSLLGTVTLIGPATTTQGDQQPAMCFWCKAVQYRGVRAVNQQLLYRQRKQSLCHWCVQYKKRCG